MANPSRRIDLFVSYATRDAQVVAEDLVNDLEALGVTCWIAPRDIPTGTRSWAAEIVTAIRNAGNFLILLTAGANASEEIEKEIDEAARQRKTLFAIRVEDIEPNPGLGYHLNRVQWRDLFRNREVVLKEIAARVIALRAVDEVPVAPAATVTTPVAPAPLPSGQPHEVSAAGKSPLLVGLLAGGGLAVAGWAALTFGLPLLTAPAKLPGTVASVPQATVPPVTQAVESASRPVAAPAPIAVAPVASAPVPATPAPVAPAPAPAAPAPALSPAAVVVPTPAVAPVVDFETALRERLAQVYPTATNEADLVRRYVNANTHKTYATAPPNQSVAAWGHASEEAAEEFALEACQLRFNRPCAAVAVNETLKPLLPDGKLPTRAMPRVAYDGLYEPGQIPSLSRVVRSRRDVQNYRQTTGFKAAAIHPDTRIFIATGASSQFAVEEAALQECNAEQHKNGRPADCLLYAAADTVVLPLRLLKPYSVETASVVLAPPPPSPAAVVAPPVVAPAVDFETALRQRLAQVYPAATDLGDRIQRYKNGTIHKTFAMAPPNQAWYIWGNASEQASEEMGLEGCQMRFNRPCATVAVNETLKPLLTDGTLPTHAMPRVAYDGLYEPDQIPSISWVVRSRRDVQNYRQTTGFKAAAIHPETRIFIATAASSQFKAEEAALRECNAEQFNRNRPADCLLYAAADTVVLPLRLQKPYSVEAVSVVQPSPASAGLALPTPVAPMPQNVAHAFDGNWDVTIACPKASDGAAAYEWKFAATIKSGWFSGEFKGTDISGGSLTGKVDENGEGVLQMRGITGAPQYAVGRVSAGTAFSYWARVKFHGNSGTGTRTQQRPCTLFFRRG